MAYYKLILNDKRLKEDQVYPIVIRVTFNRNNTTITTGIRIKKDTSSQLVKRANPNISTLNQSLSELFNGVQKIIHRLLDSNEFSFEALKEGILEKSKPSKINTSTTITDFSKKVINELIESNRSGNAIVYKTGSNRLIEFEGEIKFKATRLQPT